MQPSNLKEEQFNGYLPQARQLAVSNIAALRRLPLIFVANLLRELIDYDFKFPMERTAVKKELANLSSLSSEEIAEWFGGFFRIHLSSQLQKTDWVNEPAQFVEQLSAYLWSSHQLDAFRKAAITYGERLRKAVPEEQPIVPRLGIAIIGQGVQRYNEPLFRRLRPQGAYFSRVKPDNGVETLVSAVVARAKAHPLPYAHWYIDGGKATQQQDALTCVSYAGLESARTALMRKIHSEIEKPGMGPETLRTLMARMKPQDLGLEKEADPVMSHFQLKVLTEGSGTQIFSTTFAQWSAREALRRAQPATLLVRFAPRQRQRPMNELLSGTAAPAELDPAGSLVDADMGAYYNWLNQERLSGAGQSSFLAWFEGHREAVAIGPAMPRRTQSNTEVTLAELLSWMA